jgi:hypothetical protein
MGLSGCVYAKAFFAHTTGSNTITYEWNFGGSTSPTFNSTAAGMSVSGIYVCNTGSAMSQFMMQELGSIGGSPTFPVGNTGSTVDTTATQSISLQAKTSGSSDQVTPYMIVVSLIQ